ncbi:MAG: hypothetical protein AAFZ01_07030 [Pseudomonadota bacterium]
MPKLSISAAAMAAVLMAASSTTPTHAATVSIDRQCERYTHFCDGALRSKKAKSSVAVTVAHKRKATRRTHEPRKPFIERQCDRYGHFC